MQTAANKKNKKDSSLLNLNSLLDDLASQVTGSTITFPSHFNFTWRDILYAGQLLRRKEKGQYAITLVANLGVIPFSAEDKNRRQDMLETLDPYFMKGEFFLSPNSQIQMSRQTTFSGPSNAKRIMEVITITLLDIEDKINDIMHITTQANSKA